MKNKQPKILYISYDGAKEPIPQSQVLPYLRSFCKDGFTVHWISFDKSPRVDRERSFGSKSEKRKFKDSLMADGIRWHSLVYHKRPSLLAKFYDILHGIVYASNIVLREDIDVVHGRAEVASVIALAIKKIFKVNFIYDRRGFMAEDYVEGGMWRGRNSLRYRLSLSFDKTLMNEASWIVVLTERMKDVLKKSYPGFEKKISVIPCCVNLERFTPLTSKLQEKHNETNGKFSFLYLGSLGTWYMLNEMLDFFKLAKERIPHAHFTILTLSDLGIAKDAIRKKGFDENDFTLKAVQPPRIHEYINTADVALFFIKPVFSKVASSPTKLAECLACGLPIVMNSNIGDCDELIGNNNVGVIVKDFRVSEYTSSFNNLMEIMKDKPGLKQRCRRTAEEYFPLKRAVDAYESIYRNTP